MRGVRVLVMASVGMVCVVTAAAAQPVPQPFPRPGSPPAPPSEGRPAPPASQPTPTAPPQNAAPVPDEAMLGVPIYPTADYLASYDAGRGQRYYLFGTQSLFADMVTYYRTVLRQRGELVYDAPAVHTFDIGRFREDLMAFPPSVTIKDYTWGGSKGYLVARPDGTSQRYPTIIQVVPAAPGDR